MEFLNEMYYKSVAENERNLNFWNGYLQNLKSLDFSVYSEKLRVPALVPIGSRILFRGELKHTNEVTVALGTDYFTKCSLKQANILRQHRIKVAQEKVGMYGKEREYLQNQLTFTKQNIYENQGQEIIEYHTAEEDRVWKEKHRANVKKYMKSKDKKEENENLNKDMTDEELWDRLEELELQEELENELEDNLDLEGQVNSINDFSVIKDDAFKIEDAKPSKDVIKDDTKAIKELQNMKVLQDIKNPEQTSKLDLLQQIIDRQNVLDEKLQEIKNRERSQCKTEKDLMSRLDEIEQLDELEDEIDRLDDVIENEDVEDSEEKQDTKNLQRRVSFVDEDNSETLHITFKHSNVEPSSEPYDPDNGIQKPSDIYKANANYFKNGTTSILKKSKYAAVNNVPDILTTPITNVHHDVSKPFEQPKEKDHIVQQTIVVKDIVERVNEGNNTLQTETKPMSLFKKKRMQNKT